VGKSRKSTRPKEPDIDVRVLVEALAGLDGDATAREIAGKIGYDTSLVVQSLAGRECRGAVRVCRNAGREAYYRLMSQS
jgi:DNA-binding MarR family transcriptional regulator